MGVWKDKATGGGGDGGNRKPIMREGWHYAKIVKAITEKRDGTVLKTRHGDLKMLIVWENDDGDQATTNVTCNEGAIWVLANIFEHAEAMSIVDERYGLRDFHERKDARDKHLLGLSCWIEVDHTTDGRYANAISRASSEVPPDIITRRKGGARQEHQPIPEDDIPF